MSDTVDDFRAHKDIRAMERKLFGMQCPMCREKQPKRFPTILLPGQRCRVDGYRDTRPALTQEDFTRAGDEASRLWEQQS